MFGSARSNPRAPEVHVHQAKINQPTPRDVVADVIATTLCDLLETGWQSPLGSRSDMVG
jgi:hypothetical protein